MESFGDKLIKRHKKDFQSFKYKVKINIEHPLLRRLIPKGTLLTDVITEIWKGNITFGRQMGSYPILIGIPGKYPLKQFLNVKIIDYGYRSITGIPYPLNINTCPRKTLESIEGIGQKRAMRILQHRPIKQIEEIKRIMDNEEVSNHLLSLITI
jgi:radical SAM superfamily enzyme with C-terminal helix-hairpin-helix motif